FINQVQSFSLPLMKGDNLVVISRSGGHAVVAADVAAEYGFNLVPFSREFSDFITSHFRAQVIKPGNPLDLGDLFDIDFYITILDQVLQRPDVDGVLFNHVFQPDIEGEASLRLALTIDELSRRYHKPVALCVFTGSQAVNRLKRQISFPLFTEPAEGIEALAVSRDYARRQEEKPMFEDLPVRGNYDRQAVNAIIEKAETSQDGVLYLDQVLDIFRAYDMPLLPYRLFFSGSALPEIAEPLTFPLAVKVVAGSLSHKSDAGGVRLGIENQSQLQPVYDELMVRFGSLPDYRGLLLQSQVSTSVEMIVGGRRDESFGPVVMLGMGGIYAEIFQDTALRLPPLNANLINDMIESLKGAPILNGARGQAGIYRPTLDRVLYSLADLLADFPVIQQIDVNPLFLSNTGGFVIDGRIMLGK
ncbi:MAG: acetate--CoA ligase family protein, partial [Deltaproteobacteria bacterium]|nr:acetate--CoA ligase family protein [Deltaproteobacteria bacterium]